MTRTRLLASTLSLSLASLFAGTANAQSPAQLRPQFPPPSPLSFRQPPPLPPSLGPRAFPYLAPIGGSFQNGIQAGVINRQGASVSTYAGPGFVGGQISLPTNIGGGGR